MQVQWKVNGIFKADAAKVYKEIGTDNVTPESVLEKAKDKKSELHKCFDWDDKSAANKYRLQQARQIINLAGFGLGIGSGRSSGFGRYHIVSIK